MRLEDNFMMALSNGQSYFGDMILLSKFVEKCSIVVEIGTARGLGTMVLSMHGAKVYTIDNYINFEMGVNKSPKYPETVDSLAIKIGNYLELFKIYNYLNKDSIDKSNYKNITKKLCEIYYPLFDNNFFALEKLYKPKSLFLFIDEDLVGFNSVKYKILNIKMTYEKSKIFFKFTLKFLLCIFHI